MLFSHAAASRNCSSGNAKSASTCGAKPEQMAKVAALVKESKANAKEFLEHMCDTRWKLVTWAMKQEEGKKNRLDILTILSQLVEYIIADLADSPPLAKKSQLEFNCTATAEPLSNITNSGTIPSKATSLVQEPKVFPLKTFTKEDGLTIIHNDAILRHMSGCVSVKTVGCTEERSAALALISGMCRLAHVYRRRQIYDLLAERLLASGTYRELLESLVVPLQAEDEPYAVRAFELAATSPAGVSQLSQRLPLVMEVLNHIITKSIAPSSPCDDIQYSAVTVLLDLTASELCLERAARYMFEHNMFKGVFRELSQLMKKPGPAPAKGRDRKYKDLLAGIVLNLACNVEAEDIQLQFVDGGVVPILAGVLFDPRNDWPSNGSALALLQYAHKSLSNVMVYNRMLESGVKKDMQHYTGTKGSIEARRNVEEALAIMDIAERKQKSVMDILTKYVLPAAA